MLPRSVCGVGADAGAPPGASSTEVTLLPAHLKADAVVDAPLTAVLLAAAQVLVDPALPFDELFGVGVAPVW